MASLRKLVNLIMKIIRSDYETIGVTSSMEVINGLMAEVVGAAVHKVLDESG